MQKTKGAQTSRWIGLALACSVVAACGGGDEPVGSDSTTPAPGPAPAPTPGPAPAPAPAPTPSPAPGPAPAPNPGPAPAPITGTGLSSECLSRALFDNASTWSITNETTPADGSAKRVSTASYTSTPGVSSPAGPGTRLLADVTTVDGNFMVASFIRLEGNLLSQYDTDFTEDGTVIDVTLEFTDPSFDLALNESRTLPKTIVGFTTDITYTYLGQEDIQTALGSFTACKFTQDSRAANGTFNNTYWFAVGEGLLLKSESTSTLLGRSLGTETEDLIAATINGIAVTGN